MGQVSFLEDIQKLKDELLHYTNNRFEHKTEIDLQRAKDSFESASKSIMQRLEYLHEIVTNPSINLAVQIYELEQKLRAKDNELALCNAKILQLQNILGNTMHLHGQKFDQLATEIHALKQNRDSIEASFERQEFLTAAERYQLLEHNKKLDERISEQADELSRLKLLCQKSVESERCLLAENKALSKKVEKLELEIRQERHASDRLKNEFAASMNNDKAIKPLRYSNR